MLQLEIRKEVSLKTLLPLLACLGLFGCAQHPIPHRSGSTVPSGRRFAPSLLKSSPKRNCAITVVREPGVLGAGLNLYFDGNELARISAGETLTIYVQPGHHLLSARPLFSPVATKRLLLGKHENITIRIIDRDGNLELRTADRGFADSIANAYHSLVH